MPKRVFIVVCLTVLPATCSLAAAESPFEIIAHRTRVHLVPDAKIIHSIDTLDVRRSTEEKGEVQFLLLSHHKIEDVSIDGRNVPFERNHAGFVVDASKLKKESEVVVHFSGELHERSQISRISSTRALVREEEFLVRAARNLQFVRLTLVVPRDWQTVAVGTLVSTAAAGDSSEFVWVSEDPIATVGWICAGNYKLAAEREQSIDFSVHLFDEDSASAEPLLALSKKVTRFFAEQFGTYRFPKLAVVEIENWVGGPAVLALATPSVILLKQVTFTTSDEFNKALAVLPHEIAHQWWSQTIQVGEEDAAFLSEGISEYSVRLYDEAVGFSSARSAWQSHPLLHSLMMRARRGKEVPLNRPADLRALPTHYLKAAYVHHMLRGIVGDNTFRKIYSTFASRHRLKQSSLREFQQLCEEFYGKSLGWFFDQWVKETGLPRLRLYNIKRAQEGNGWVVRGRVRLVGYTTFTVPVGVGVTTSDGTAKTSVWIGPDSSGTVKNDLPFEIRTLLKPLRVSIDPDGEILKMQKMPVRLTDLREASNGLMIVGTREHGGRLLDLARRDSAEMEQAGWSIYIKADTASTLSDYRGERVFLYGGPASNSIAAQLATRFPILCDDRRCVWREKVYADTTLAITQIIENPFQEQGLLCWLIPLGENSIPILRPLRASAVVARGGEAVESWTWDVRDEELEFEFKD